MIRDNAAKHRFEADLGDGSMAIAEYNLLSGKIVFTHTEVPTAHEGQGIGSGLIRYAPRSSRERPARHARTSSRHRPPSSPVRAARDGSPKQDQRGRVSLEEGQLGQVSSGRSARAGQLGQVKVGVSAPE